MMWKDSADKINDKYISVGPDTFQIRHHAYKLPPFLNQPTEQCQHQETHTTQIESTDLVKETEVNKAFPRYGVDVFLYVAVLKTAKQSAW